MRINIKAVNMAPKTMSGGHEQLATGLFLYPNHARSGRIWSSALIPSMATLVAPWHVAPWASWRQAARFSWSRRRLLGGRIFGCGLKPRVPFWGRCTSILVYFSGDWDVYWGYGVLTHGHLLIGHGLWWSLVKGHRSPGPPRWSSRLPCLHAEGALQEAKLAWLREASLVSLCGMDPFGDTPLAAGWLLILGVMREGAG